MGPDRLSQASLRLLIETLLLAAGGAHGLKPDSNEVAVEGLKADSNEVAVEGITLAHEGFKTLKTD